MSDDANKKLLQMRKSIDNLDAAFIHVIAERFRITKAVGVLKANNDFSPSDPDREKEQIFRLRKMAADAELDPEFAEKLLNFIIEEVIRHHKQAKGEE